MRASSLPRLEACPASERLPGISETSEFAEAGTIRHRFLQTCYERSREEALLEAPTDHLVRLEAIDVPVFPGKISCEVTLEWRGITGHADVVAATSDGVFILDWKGAFAEVDDPSTNLQLGFYAVAAIAKFNLPMKATIIVARIMEDGEVRFIRADLDSDALLSIARRIAATQEAVRGENPRLQMGGHCRYCPAWRACPAHISVMHEIGRGVLGIDAEWKSPEMVFLTHDKLSAAEKTIEEAKKTLRTYVAATGKLEWNGRTLEVVNEERRSVDGEKAFPILLETIGEIGARAACEIKTSFTAIKDVVKDKDKVKSIEARLTDSGAVAVKVIQKLKEKKSGK